MIEAYTGMVGSGKTYRMVDRVRQYIGKRAIYANDQSFRFAEAFGSWEELLSISDAIVLVDEMAIWAAARSWAKMPPEVASYFAQSRKRGVDLLYTAQSMGGVDAVVRRLTSIVHQCDRWGPAIRDRERDGLSGEYLCTSWTFVRRQVYELYDTYAIVSDGDGNGGGVGEARFRKAAQIAVRALRAHPVVLCPLPEGGWRRATVFDLCADVPVLLNGKPWRDYDRGVLMDLGRLGQVATLVRWMGVVEVGCAAPRQVVTA